MIYKSVRTIFCIVLLYCICIFSTIYPCSSRLKMLLTVALFDLNYISHLATDRRIRELNEVLNLTKPKRKKRAEEVLCVQMNLAQVESRVYLLPVLCTLYLSLLISLCKAGGVRILSFALILCLICTTPKMIF